HAFLDEVFDDPALYDQGARHEGASHGVSQLLEAGWRLVGITARPAHLAPVTRAWLRRNGFALDAVHHTPVGTKAAVARRVGAVAAIGAHPLEAGHLGRVAGS